MNQADFYPLPPGFEIHDFLIQNLPYAMHAPELTTVAQAFFDNIITIRHLVSLPILTPIGGLAQAGVAQAFIATLVESYRKGDDISLLLEEHVINHMGKMVSEAMSDKDQRSALHGTAKQHFSMFHESSITNTAVSALCTAATTMAWTSFECLATDAWVAALNTRSPQNVGTLMRQKFDFTGLNGFREAYKAGLGDNDHVKELFKNDDLEILEAVRHILVHRAGNIDQRFLNRVNRPRLLQRLPHPLPAVDTPFPLNAVFTSRWINAVIDVGLKLLVFVNHWASEQFLLPPTQQE